MLLAEIKKQIQYEGYFIGTWDEISEATYIDVETKSGLNEFRELLSNSGLECFPKIVNGSVANVERSLSAISMVIFTKGTPLDKDKENIKYALLVGKIAAAMAKADGEVAKEEVNQIREDINKLSFLSESEKYRVFIRTVYATRQNYSREKIFSSFSKLSVKAKLQSLEIAKDIAIADHRIERHERLFLYDLYRLCDIPPKNVDRDLKLHAKKKNVMLERKQITKEDVSQVIVDLDDSFEELLSEFENF
ncbi:TerB family tellurite resistance protein [Pseudoalteromonas ruthenica]|uniref:Co-chaperone DjlA N-terminal domain-containing protein n=1 Tax=Pseudoalteromonas ruthenica TaxID=151081 RepID=A0A0F4Q106_9GAMM|nr:TerB family tellurite resistance protein [Pseudoalteromonas ruthenica]KJY95875.1 hypothetical protein TW76_15100 [Pseudoalteromonas ruthenica]KJZ00237.1 hypothetical protein TW72_05845 [Pseudoalteromonas ruthenica]TMO91873.1 TerB family tellurite resistance protein [Pseudoalteromonas ruthenica]TMO96659.1 TerB family tellurite resistance protein [Pseudoalteromonas ruthenica]TMP05859.1 TerB family tellurite resistance protein [Pseudoalteromonas ruthenica]